MQSTSIPLPQGSSRRRQGRSLIRLRWCLLRWLQVLIHLPPIPPSLLENGAIRAFVSRRTLLSADAGQLHTPHLPPIPWSLPQCRQRARGPSLRLPRILLDDLDQTLQQPQHLFVASLNLSSALSQPLDLTAKRRDPAAISSRTAKNK